MMTGQNNHTLPRPEKASFTRKSLVMLVVMAAAFALIYFTPARKYLGDIQIIKSWLLSLGWVGPAVWMGIVFVLVAAGMPRLLFCPIGGLAFGFWYGLLWTQLATLFGSYVLFLFVRWGGQDFVLRHWPRVERLKKHFHGHSAVLLVFGVRQLPISGLILNFLLGLFPIQHRHFLLGTAFGILPQAIPFTLVASGVFKLTGGNTPLYIVAAVGIFLLMCAVMWYFSRHVKLLSELRNENEGADEEPNVPVG
ncbi:MAG TPA: VTT domain-containing protein [Thermodesulfobacteriota bacterium]|nr:VTT domain-containing protein [Thermodesulfobacteriota bacterium]